MNFRLRPLSIFSGLSVVIWGLIVVAATPVSGESQSKIENQKSHIGNYCLECHTATPANALDWAKPVEWARDIPCDTLRKAHEDIFQIDTLNSAFANANAELRTQFIDTSIFEKRFNARTVTALKPMQSELVSRAAFSNYERAVRYQMNKAYAALNDARVERGRWVMLLAAFVTTLVLVIGIFLAWRHTRKGKGVATRSRSFWPVTILTVVGVFILFALPIFAFAPPLPTPTEEETERQAASDQATRVSDAASRLSAQAWTFAHIGARWNTIDQAQGTNALNDARQAARDKEIQALAYWGQIQTLRESAVAWNPSTRDLASFRIDTIEYAAASPWQYRAMASEWLTIDKTKSAELLDLGISKLKAPISDLELRAIAVTYAQIDKTKANELVARITDPMIRAWGWRELGSFDQAIDAARAVNEPYNRAWALREIARASGNVAVLNEALDAANKIENAETRAYAIADIAAVWALQDATKSAQVASQIDVAYPEARTLAWRGIGNVTRAKDAFNKSIAEAKRVSNRYRSEKLTAAVLVDAARLNSAFALDHISQITDSILRDQVYLAVIPLTAKENRDQAVDSAKRIASPGLRVLALTEIGKAAIKAGDKSKAVAVFKDALALADQVEGTFVLRDLAIAWAEIDSQAALALVDKLEDNSDKAAALQVIAVQLAKTDKAASAQAFDRATNVAKSIRVLGDSFAAARALTSLASSYTAIDATRANAAFALALEVAKKVNVKY